MRITALAMLALWVACGEGDPGPEPGDLFPWSDQFHSSCAASCLAGCCQGEVCMTGQEAHACGSGGHPCQSCYPDVCSNQACTTQGCGPSSCSGCCSAAGCQSGDTALACGTGGQTCQVCDNATQSCSQHQCVGQGGYKVILVSLIIEKSWVACGPVEVNCDPLVELTIGSQSKTSTTKNDTSTPVWYEELLTATQNEIMAGFHVVVRDEDYSFNEKIGDCSPPVTAPDLLSGKLVVPACSMYVKDLTFEFKPI